MTAQQSGKYWDHVRVRVEGFADGYALIPAPGSSFQDVTVNGQPYVPTIEACGDGIDNDKDGLTDEGCLP